MLWARLRLTAWGRWARGGLPSLPTVSSIALFDMGHCSSHQSCEMPPHIAEIDHLICIAPQPEKNVLIHFYAKEGSLADKARMLRMTRWRFKRVLGRAESYVENSI